MSASEGVGLVHSAPGHVPEDFDVRVANDIPVFTSVDIKGNYTKDAGKFVFDMGLLNEMFISMKDRNKKVELEILVVLIIWMMIAPIGWLIQVDHAIFILTLIGVYFVLGVFLFFIYIREVKRNTKKELKKILFKNSSAKLLKQ